MISKRKTLNFDFQINAIDNRNEQIDNLMKPFMLQKNFHYALFMEYNECDCVALPTSRDVGISISVSRFY